MPLRFSAAYAVTVVLLFLCRICHAYDDISSSSSTSTSTSAAKLKPSTKLPPPPPPFPPKNRNGVLTNRYPSPLLSELEDERSDDDDDDDKDSISSSSPSSPPVVQVIETEIWDAASESWKAHNHRWTNEKGEPGKSPSEAIPPESFRFVGDWKIAIKTGYDSLGWEYQFRYLHPPTRRRIWLRTLEKERKPPKEIEATIKGDSPPLPPKIKEKSQVIVKEKGKDQTLSAKRKRRRKRRLARWFRDLRDEFTFKGYSLSLKKSFTSLQSFGASTTMPITRNFDWWDRHPELPSVTAGLAVFFPFTAISMLSCSIHYALLQWAVIRALLGIRRAVSVILYYSIVRTLTLILSILIYPFVGSQPGKKIISVPSLPPYKPLPRPRLGGTDIQHRVGATLSYRYSKTGGFEWRVSYWMAYMPTLRVYRNALGPLLRLPKLSSWSDDESSSADFWKVHFACLGIDTGGPTPSPPHFSATGALSMSGFYFKKATKPATSISLRSSSLIESELTKTRRNEEKTSIAVGSSVVKTKVKQQ